MKRTVFRNPWLPYRLVLPQVAITVVFFLWPAFDWGAVVVHLLLVGTVLTIGFPLYYALVNSTQSFQEVISRPPNLLPL